MKRFFLICILLFTIVGCGSPDTPTIRILFIGNSYTFVNDLPGMFAKLSEAGGHRVEVGMEAPGGWSLADHVESAQTRKAIRSSKWDYVVLQEQSQIPASKYLREQEMYPPARVLIARIREVGATPILYLTPAHLNGWPDMELMDYDSMQYQINAGYYGIAQELNAIVAPVGVAWSSARGQNPDLLLWQADGSHPDEQGTYLAACVFYAVIFHESPLGINYRGNLSRDVAEMLQTVASRTVLNIP